MVKRPHFWGSRMRADLHDILRRLQNKSIITENDIDEVIRRFYLEVEEEDDVLPELPE